MPILDDFEDREEFPSDEMLQNWNEANDYLHEGDEEPEQIEED